MDGTDHQTRTEHLSYKLACFQEHPKELHAQGIRSTLRYVRGQFDLGLTYHKDNKDPMYEVCDAIWKSETNSRSRRGLTIMRAGAAVMWDSKIIPRACLSSCGSEYIAGTETTKDIIYYREPMREVGWRIKEPTLIQIENKSAIHMAQDAASHKTHSIFWSEKCSSHKRSRTEPCELSTFPLMRTQPTTSRRS
jgi:hypothetical protein